MYSLGWVGRIFADSYKKLLLINSYKNLSTKLLHIPWSAYSYELALKKELFSFIISGEINFNLARIIFPAFINDYFQD